MHKKIVVSIPLYFPEDNITQILSVLRDKDVACIVWLNSVISAELSAMINSFENVIVLGDHTNVGLSEYLVQSAKYGRDNGYELLLNWDQDTVFTGATIDSILNFDQMKLHHNWVQVSFLGKTRWPRKEKILINSASLFNLSTLHAIGYHPNDLFVDGVDYLFCLKALNLNKKLYSMIVSGIDHSVNQDFIVRKILGITIRCKNVNNKRFREILDSHVFVIMKAFFSGNIFFGLKISYFFGVSGL